MANDLPLRIYKVCHLPKKLYADRSYDLYKNTVLVPTYPEHRMQYTAKPITDSVFRCVSHPNSVQRSAKEHPLD